MGPKLSGLALAVPLCLAVSAAWAQPPLPLDRVPKSFKVIHQETSKTGARIEAARPNKLVSKLAVDPDMHLVWNWQLMPGAEKLIEMLVKSPEDPSSQTGMTTVDPEGKEVLKGGVLIWRRTTIPWVGGGDAPPWVTFEGTWFGAVEGGLLSVGVSNAAESKAALLPFIQAFLDSSKVASK